MAQLKKNITKGIYLKLPIDYILAMLEMASTSQCSLLQNVFKPKDSMHYRKEHKEMIAITKMLNFKEKLSPSW